MAHPLEGDLCHQCGLEPRISNGQGKRRRWCRKCFNAHRLAQKDPLPGVEMTVEEPAAEPEPPLAIPRPVSHKEHSGILGCVTSDDHHPDSNRPFWAAKLAWIRQHQPDRVELNGDFLEFASVSMHGKTPVGNFLDLEQDFDTGRRVLRELRAAAPNAEITYLEGNHETRVARFIAESAPAQLQRSIGGVQDELHLERLGIRYVPEHEQPIEIGTLDLLHGHQVPGRFLPIHHAKKVAELYGRPDRIVAFGHSHRPQEFWRPSKYGNTRCIAIGAGRDLDPRWMKGGPGGWGASWLIYQLRGGRTDVQHVHFGRGAFTWGPNAYSEQAA